LEEMEHDRRARAALETGKPEGALAHYQDALKASRSIEDQEGMAANLINISVVLRALGRGDEAMVAVDEILRQDPVRFDERWVSEAAFMKALLLQDCGRSDEAASWAARAFASCRQSECEDIGRIYNLMAKMAFDRQDAERAALFSAQALEASQKCGDRGETANAYRLMGDLKGSSGAPAEAMSLYENALALDKELGRSRKIALDLMGLGSAHKGLGETAKALQYFRRALAVAEASGDKELPARILDRIRALESR
jgi:tetratricopeptide (TPR) repeat protein